MRLLLNFEIGADDYLTRPFAFAELLVRVKALLRRGAVSPVRHLRNEIDEPFERKLIRTFRGVGNTIGGEEGI